MGLPINGVTDDDDPCFSLMRFLALRCMLLSAIATFSSNIIGLIVEPVYLIQHTDVDVLVIRNSIIYIHSMLR